MAAGFHATHRKAGVPSTDLKIQNSLIECPGQAKNSRTTRLCCFELLQLGTEVRFRRSYGRFRSMNN